MKGWMGLVCVMSRLAAAHSNHLHTVPAPAAHQSSPAHTWTHTMPNIFPDKACYCFPLTSAVNVCLVLAVLLRVAGVTCESVLSPAEGGV